MVDTFRQHQFKNSENQIPEDELQHAGQTKELDSTQSAAGDSRQTLSDEAISLYQCPQGFIVNNPTECGDRASLPLPELAL